MPSITATEESKTPYSANQYDHGVKSPLDPKWGDQSDPEQIGRTLKPRNSEF